MIDFNDFKSAERVFHYFEEISKIPHGSGNTEKIADYLASFAKAHNLEFYKDSANNVLIKKAAAKGFEDRPTVILQGHTDMVAEKLPELEKDMESEGLSLYRDGDFLRARGTTLGGDDGVAVAYALAILEADDIPHPPIEALFTSDEEIGLIGAGALDTSVLDGRILINIDSDEEGVFTVGCAGGARVDISLPVNYDKGCGGTAYKLTVNGLLGGHSGVEINRGRANAVKLAGEILKKLCDVKILSINGGSADNAIPRECSVTFTSEGNAEEALEDSLKEFRKAYVDTDKDINASLKKIKQTQDALDFESTRKLLSIICGNKSGVIYMSEDIEGLPESSQNLGIVKIEDGIFKCTFSVRSAKASRKAELIEKLRASAIANGADFGVRGEYPAWEYEKESHIRDVACEVYRKMYKKDAKVIVIHAGLECGIFSDKIAGLDCISLGPDNFDIHTTEEHLSISSTARVYEFLKEILAKI